MLDLKPLKHTEENHRQYHSGHRHGRGLRNTKHQKAMATKAKIDKWDLN